MSEEKRITRMADLDNFPSRIFAAPHMSRNNISNRIRNDHKIPSRPSRPNRNVLFSGCDEFEIDPAANASNIKG
jgi:hypothetical protein